jgi:signal transduction histidine kinase
MSDARLLEAINSLITCKDLEELASSAALLARRLVGVAGAIVVLRSSERVFASPAQGTCAELEPWAMGLAALPQRGLVSSGSFRAAPIDPPNADVQGVLAVSLEASEPASGSAERESSLAALADVIASCSAQIARGAQADRSLQDVRALVARGLHDLCTPLNSLRLGMHLLEPALTNKDAAIAQRAHRAVDRMAALVTSMAEAIGGASGNGQTGVSTRSASSTPH